jgi:hypothetical protein
VVSEYISSWTASVRSVCPNKFNDLNDGIRRQLVKLNTKFAKNVHKHWMQWHMEPSSKKVFEQDNFVDAGL